MFRRDPAAFRRLIPAAAQSLSDEELGQQLEAAASLPGAELRKMQNQQGSFFLQPCVVLCLLRQCLLNARKQNCQQARRNPPPACAPKT